MSESRPASAPAGHAEEGAAFRRRIERLTAAVVRPPEARDVPADAPRPPADAEANAVLLHGCDAELRCTWAGDHERSPWNAHTIGRRDDELFEPISAARLMRLKRDALSTGRGVRRELHLIRGGRPWVLDARAEPQRDAATGRVTGLVVAAVDVTARDAAAARRRVLADLDERLRRDADDADAILAAVTRLAAEHFGLDRCCWARIAPGGRAFVVEAWHVRGAGGTRGRGRRPPRTAARRAAARLVPAAARGALRAGRAWTMTSGVDDDAAPRLAAVCRRMGGRSAAMAAARRGPRVAGVLAAFAAEPRAWADEDLSLLAALADRARVALDRADLERARREDQERLRVALEVARMGDWSYDLADGTLTCSPRCLAMLGLPADGPDAGPADGPTAADGRVDHDGRLDQATLRSRIAAEDWAAVVRAARRAAVGRGACEVEYRVLTPGGGTRTIFASARALYDAPTHADAAPPHADRSPTSHSHRRGATATRLVGVMLDVTDRRRAEADQRHRLDAERHARAESERVGRLKDEFLATLSHELRTPLHAILGWTQLLRRRPPAAGELDVALATIERNAAVQAQLVNDLLDMSRIISGKIRLEVRPIDLRDVVAAALEVVRPAADAKRVRLEFEPPDPLAPPCPVVQGDPARLQQVAWNLLANAVKFTPADGTVRVRVEAGAGGGEATIAVADTGQGITPEFLPHVFERFRQADGSTRRSHGGLGLGLSIVKTLVELHGGRVGVASDGPGRGATFRVALPAITRGAGDPAPAAATPSAPPPPSRGEEAAGGWSASAVFATHGAAAAAALPAGLRVLVVDDDADALTLVERMLAEHGVAVTTAGGADAALTALGEGRGFDALVSDLGMPGRDGFDLIRAVRAQAATRALPAAALTAFARVEDRDRALAAGFDAHLTKPVDAAELVAAIARLTQHGATPAPS